MARAGHPDPLAGVSSLPGVDETVAATRLALDRMAGHRVQRRRGDAVRTESLLRGASGAAAVQLGRTVDLEEARAAVEDHAGADPVVRGAVRAYADIGSLAQVWRQAPRQALARLHMIAARDLVAPDALGRPRGPAETDRLAQLGEVILATDAPAVVVAAVVHGELATLQPFGSADRVVAMAASRLVLLDRGLDPGGYAVVEVGHQDVQDPAALSGFTDGTGAGVAAWLIHYGSAVQKGAQEALAIAESILRG